MLASSSASSYAPIGKDNRWPGFASRRKALLLVAVLVVTTATVAVLKSKKFTQDPAGVGLERKERLITTYTCSPGAHQTGTDANGNCVCEKCPAGSKCAGDVSPPMKCSPGHYQDEPGQDVCKVAEPGYFAQGEGNTQQTPCEAGTFAPVQATAQCQAASKGHFVANPGQDHQVPCDPGQFQDKEGQTSCKAAEPGNFAEGQGAIEELACQPGTYQPDAGQPSCDDADLGHYVDTLGATEQRPCHLGSFASTTKSIVCTLAREGRFVGAGGAHGDEACAAGTYQHCPGQKMCIPCEAGTVQPAEGQTSCQKAITYRKSSRKMTFDEAKAYCTKYEMILVEPRGTSQEENAALYCPNANERCWLGMNDENHDNQYHYLSDGAAVTTNSPPWADREPNNPDTEPCAEMNHGAVGRWNDVSCTGNRFALCQST